MKTIPFKVSFYRLTAYFLLLTVFSIKSFSQSTPSPPPAIQKCWESAIVRTGSDNALRNFPVLETAQIVVNEKFKFLLSFGEGFLKSLDFKTGEERWLIDSGGKWTTEPLIQSNGIFIVTKPLLDNKEPLNFEKQIHNIRVINKETGITEWTKTFFMEGKIYLYGFKNVIFLVNPKGRIITFDQSNGNVLWEKSYSEDLSSSPLFFGDMVLFPGNLGFLLVSLNDGKEIFRRKNNFPLLKSLSANEEMLFLGDERGFIEGFEISSKKKKWSYRLGGAVTNIVYRKGYILVTSLDNFIYYFSAADGKLVWKKRAAGRIIYEPLIFDQAVLILAEGSEKALLIDLSEGKVINQLNFPDDTYLTGNPKKIGEMLVFPTQKSIIAYSFGQCP